MWPRSRAERRAALAASRSAGRRCRLCQRLRRELPVRRLERHRPRAAGAVARRVVGLDAGHPAAAQAELRRRTTRSGSARRVFTLVNVAVHLVNALLVFALLRRWPRGVAGATSIAAVGRGAGLCAAPGADRGGHLRRRAGPRRWRPLFVLASLLAWIAGRERGSRWLSSGALAAALRLRARDARDRRGAAGGPDAVASDGGPPRATGLGDARHGHALGGARRRRRGGARVARLPALLRNQHRGAAARRAVADPGGRGELPRRTARPLRPAQRRPDAAGRHRADADPCSRAPQRWSPCWHRTRQPAPATRRSPSACSGFSCGSRRPIRCCRGSTSPMTGSSTSR